MEYSYKDDLRMGYLADLYCEIAMEEFYEATKLYELLRKNNFSRKLKYEENELNKHVLKTIVFSAMTVESFLNNYVAVCIGDSEFYQNFDKLTPLSKLQLIVKFIFKCEYDSSKSYHSYLKRLFSLRNDYVHNKSSSLHLSQEEWSEIVSEVISDYFNDSPNRVKSEDRSLNKAEITDDYNDAVIALRAIKELALFFDEHDNNVQAFQQLFHPEILINRSQKEKEYKTAVFSKLNIKAEDYYEV